MVGCKGGGRSLRAAELMQAAGYTSVVDQRAGFDGHPGEPGWRPKGLPTDAKGDPDRAYEALRAKK